MSIPSKTTIDNLPSSASQRYATDEISIKGSKFYQDISSVAPSASPQVAVVTPIQASQLETLTGGSLHEITRISIIEKPPANLEQNVFTHTVFPAFYQKDKELVESKLQNLITDSTRSSVDKVLKGLSTISDLNKMGDDAFANCRRLKQG